MRMLAKIFPTGGGSAHTTFDHRGRQNQHKIPCSCFKYSYLRLLTDLLCMMIIVVRV